MFVERDALSRLSHPRVVRLLDTLKKRNQHCALVLEYAKAGDLMSFLQDQAVPGKERLPEKVARTLVLQLLEALDHCENRNVRHRDVKPENMFLDENFCLKLGDFGLATTMDTSVTWDSSPVGTIGYMSPEVMDQKVTQSKMNMHLFKQQPQQLTSGGIPPPSSSPKSDVWSAGGVLFGALFGVPPFGEVDDWWYDKIYNEEWDEFFSTHRTVYQQDMGFAQYPNLSNQALDVLKLMLCSDIKNRGTIREIMEHSFFSKNKILTDLEMKIEMTRLTEVNEPATLALIVPSITQAQVELHETKTACVAPKTKKIQKNSKKRSYSCSAFNSTSNREHESLAPSKKKLNARKLLTYM
jgi:serine/threonine protein kinase